MAKDETDLQEKELEIIEGEFINISQSTVRNVEGGHVEMQQVCALSIDGEKIEATQAAALLLRGSEIDLNQSISAAVIGDNTSLNFSLAPVSVSRGDTTINRSAAGIIAAPRINADNTTAFIILANNVEGNITTLLDWKSTFALGAVAGGIWGLFSLFKRR